MPRESARALRDTEDDEHRYTGIACGRAFSDQALRGARRFRVRPARAWRDAYGRAVTTKDSAKSRTASRGLSIRCSLTATSPHPVPPRAGRWRYCRSGSRERHPLVPSGFVTRPAPDQSSGFNSSSKRWIFCNSRRMQAANACGAGPVVPANRWQRFAHGCCELSTAPSTCVHGRPARGIPGGGAGGSSGPSWWQFVGSSAGHGRATMRG